MTSTFDATTAAVGVVTATLRASACSVSVGVGDGAPVSKERLRSFVSGAVRAQTGQRVDCVYCPSALSRADDARAECTATYDDVSISVRVAAASSGDEPRLKATTNGAPTGDTPLAISASRLIPVVTQKYEALRPVEVQRLSCFRCAPRSGRPRTASAPSAARASLTWSP